MADSAQSTIETTNLDRCYELITILGNQWRFNRQVVDEFLKAHSNINNPEDGVSLISVNETKEVANG